MTSPHKFSRFLFERLSIGHKTHLIKQFYGCETGTKRSHQKGNLTAVAEMGIPWIVEAIYKDCTQGSGHIFVLPQLNGS